MGYEELDKKFGTDGVDVVYSQLKERYEKGEKDKELLWRLGRSCHELAAKEADKNKKKRLIVKGQAYCVEAYNQDQTSFPVLKWVAVTTGQLTGYLGTKEKIEQGSKFKEYLDKALDMDKKEYSLLHMRGRYAFGVAGLNWFERKAASVFYSTPSTATYDEALADFLAAHETRPDWLENIFYIAKTYLQLKDKTNAKKYLSLGLALKTADESECDIHADMQKMLKKV